MAKLLLGSENNLFSFNNTFYNDVCFFLFKRRIYKDEIKKGNTSIDVQVSGTEADLGADHVTINDLGAATNFDVGPARR